MSLQIRRNPMKQNINHKDIRAADICGVPAFVCACDYPDGGAVPPD